MRILSTKYLTSTIVSTSTGSVQALAKQSLAELINLGIEVVRCLWFLQILERSLLRRNETETFIILLNIQAVCYILIKRLL